MLPANDGSGGLKEYYCDKLHRLLIPGSQVAKLMDLGFSPKRLVIKTREHSRESINFMKVVSVEDEGKVCYTYCGNEPKNHTLMFNGHLTMNCTEIFQNTKPNHYKVKIWLNDGKNYLLFDEDEDVRLSNGRVKKANKVTALDTLDEEEGNTLSECVSLKVFNVEKEKIDGDTAVCNLASINLSRINTKEDIERVVPIAIRMLDNVIDLNYYPLNKVKYTNLKSRSIGLGVMGEAQMLAEKQIYFGSQQHFILTDIIMEAISYNAIKSSSDLAIEKGIYPTFEGSKWSQGIMPFDHVKSEVNHILFNNDEPRYSYNWDELREKVKKDGMRNGYIMAIAPTSSISILVGTTQAIEPVYKRKWFEENLSGLIPVVVPNLSPDTYQYYTPAYEVEQTDIIKAAAIRQKWIDQGQSTNIFMSLDKASGKYLHEIYTLAWKLGLKSTYYLRSQSPEAKNDVEDRSLECSGCQ
jgi:ribonucleoside-diphosphate reductase alpha chain